MATDKPKVEPNETEGRALGRTFLSGSGGDTIAMDTELIAEVGYEWQRKANLLRSAADDIANIGSSAQGQAQDFRDKYVPSGAYTADYASMSSTDAAYAAKLREAADQAEKLAGACVWLSRHWDEVQEEHAAKTAAIDTDLGADGGTSAGDEPRVYGTEVHGDPLPSGGVSPAPETIPA